MKVEPVELVDGLDVRCEIRRSRGGSPAEMKWPFPEVGKTARRFGGGDVRSPLVMLDLRYPSFFKWRE